MQLLSRQLATSLASVVLFEEEIRRGQRAAKMAAMDRHELSEQLAARTQEARDSETKFTRMAELAPVGMFIANSYGRITYCNDSWYEISRVPKESDSTNRWIDFVVDEDKPAVRQLWNDLVVNTKLSSAEFRFKAPWLDRNGVLGETWVLLSAYPETGGQGALRSVFGSITNISQQKWVEGLQKRKMEEAVELKRQQENFIDITSHEMRNPLSAMLQCSDEIISSLSRARAQQPRGASTTVFDDNIDSAQTIALCAQHQKRIIDDVLTLSKLDSALLIVTPVDVQPMTVVQRALKMFEGELQTADIQMRFVVDRSFKELGINWVRFDPSRVLQVLINLTTNAIKFTTTESRRTITITIAASLHKPSKEEDTIVNYIPIKEQRVDIFKTPDWGDGEDVFIHFAVRDTGRGLSEEEIKLLFQRFSQASPRTHVQVMHRPDSDCARGTDFAYLVRRLRPGFVHLTRADRAARRRDRRGLQGRRGQHLCILRQGQAGHGAARHRRGDASCALPPADDGKVNARRRAARHAVEAGLCRRGRQRRQRVRERAVARAHRRGQPGQPAGAAEAAQECRVHRHGRQSRRRGARPIARVVALGGPWCGRGRLACRAHGSG